MEIVVRTEYNYKQLLRLQHFHIKKKKALWGFVLLCNTLIFVLLASSLHSFGWNPEAYIELTLLIIIMLTVPAMIYCSPRHAVKNSARLGALYVYKFSDEGFTITCASEHMNENTYIHYKSLYKIYETKNCFYIYLTKMQAYILDKNGFENGSCEDLRALLRAGVRAPALKIYR